MEEYKKILVPVDGSDLSKKALEKALALAKVFGSEVSILHVNENVPASYGFPGMEGIEITKEMVKEQTEDYNETLLKEYTEIFRKAGMEVISDIVYGNPANEIIEASKDFDLIVMGSHGLGGLFHLLIGGTAEKVIRHACCPVFLIRDRTQHCKD